MFTLAELIKLKVLVQSECEWYIAHGILDNTYTPLLEKIEKEIENATI